MSNLNLEEPLNTMVPSIDFGHLKSLLQIQAWIHDHTFPVVSILYRYLAFDNSVYHQR